MLSALINQLFIANYQFLVSVLRNHVSVYIEIMLRHFKFDEKVIGNYLFILVSENKSNFLRARQYLEKTGQAKSQGI